MSNEMNLAVKESDKTRLSKRKVILIIIAAVLCLTIAVVACFSYELDIYTNISNRKLATPNGVTYIQFFQEIADKYGVSIERVTGARYKVIRLHSSNFDTLSDKDKLRFFAEFGTRNTNKPEVFDKSGKDVGEYLRLLYVVCNNKEYEGYIDDAFYGPPYRNGKSQVRCDGKVVYYEYSGEKNSSSSSSSSTSGKVKCTMCNGTGKVKYYYGDSALEAALDGKNDYELGPCSSCDGTGYVKTSSSGKVCGSCGKSVSSLSTKKDASGTNRTWCSSCWKSYWDIMG